MYASKAGHTLVAKVLIKNGANINAVEKETERNSLFLASENGREETVKFFGLTTAPDNAGIPLPPAIVQLWLDPLKFTFDSPVKDAGLLGSGLM